MKHKLNGILLLDKPIGLTSNEALQVVKKLFGATKAGHTGSLDPIASGMLPLCFGEATKFSQFLLESDKQYFVTAKLGEVTPSGDGETAVIETRAVQKISAKNFEEILSKFRGKTSQVPPMYSAIKFKGQPLYKLIRQGIEVVRNPREINIYKLQLLGFNNNFAEFYIHCSKGTYVRTLIVDIGESLECGAYVSALRRLAVGHYQQSQMISLDKLRELAAKNKGEELVKLLLPIETMLVGMPEVVLTHDMVYYAASGQSVFIPDASKTGWVKLKNKNGKFLGVGEVVSDGKVIPRKMCRF